MNFLVYCQHVLGLGHLFRTAEIIKALSDHSVTLVLGGPKSKLSWPDHVRVVSLPPLMMDQNFSGLQTIDQGRPLDAVKKQRTEILGDLFTSLCPDVLLVELFPFGRNAFRFELIPLMEQASKQDDCLSICSVRDILVERDNTEKFEQRAVQRLNDYFDHLLIHSDRDIIALDLTFSKMAEITIPIHYTGFISQNPATKESGQALRNKLQLSAEKKLIVASAGGGNVGYSLLKATLEGHKKIHGRQNTVLHLFTGPYLEDANYQQLEEIAGKSATVHRFTDAFPTWLAAADLSVSMAGYNTTMNILSAGCPALLYPFSQNQEQRLRLEKLKPFAPLSIIEEEMLQPAPMAEQMADALTQKRPQQLPRIDGATRTAELLCTLTRRLRK